MFNCLSDHFPHWQFRSVSYSSCRTKSWIPNIVLHICFVLVAISQEQQGEKYTHIKIAPQTSLFLLLITCALYMNHPFRLA